MVHDVAHWHGECSPEMVRSQPYSTASDVFSMGMVMYEVFGGFIRSACLPHGSAHALEDMATRVCAPPNLASGAASPPRLPRPFLVGSDVHFLEGSWDHVCEMVGGEHESEFVSSCCAA